MKKSAVAKISKVSQKKVKNQVVQSSLFGIKSDRYINEPKNLDLRHKQNLKIVHWNVNGLRAIAKKDVLDQYFNNYDIICLSETKIDLQKLKQENFHLHKLWHNKFNQYWSFSTIKKGYSGCVIFSKLRPIKVNYGIDVQKFDSEGRFTIMEYQDFYLVNVYVPNSKRGLLRLDERVNEFDLEFRKFLEKLKQKKMLVVVGDFNVAHQEIDIADPKNNKKSAGFTDQERQSFTKLLETGLVDVWRKTHQNVVQYSWWSNLQKHKTRAERKGWRIDYCLIDNEHEENIKKTELRDDVMGSDHCPMEIDIQLQVLQKEEDQKQENNDNNQNNPKDQNDQNNKKDEDQDENNLSKQQKEQNKQSQEDNMDKKDNNEKSEAQKNHSKLKKEYETQKSNYLDKCCQNWIQNQQQLGDDTPEFRVLQKTFLENDRQTINNSITFQNFQSCYYDNASQDISNNKIPQITENNKQRYSSEIQANKAIKIKKFSFGNQYNEDNLFNYQN